MIKKDGYGLEMCSFYVFCTELLEILILHLEQEDRDAAAGFVTLVGKLSPSALRSANPMLGSSGLL